jgi:hypothetical protein
MIEISNPREGGARYTSERRARDLMRRGIAEELPDGRLHFVEGMRTVFLASESAIASREEAAEFRRNRGDRVYWNGARNYRGAAYPPGCNVQFEKVDG